MDEVLDNFEILSNRVRFEIVYELSFVDKSAVDFIDNFDISIPGIMKHLQLLERAGVISRNKIGRRNMCSLTLLMRNTLRKYPELLEVDVSVW